VARAGAHAADGELPQMTAGTVADPDACGGDRDGEPAGAEEQRRVSARAGRAEMLDAKPDAVVAPRGRLCGRHVSGQPAAWRCGGGERAPVIRLPHLPPPAPRVPPPGGAAGADAHHGPGTRTPP